MSAHSITGGEKRQRVLVAHPGRQHSHQLAFALHEAGVLERFVCGVPISRRHVRSPLRRFVAERQVPSDIVLPDGKVDCWPSARVMSWTAERALPPAAATAASRRTERLFDRWVADALPRFAVTHVVCYENSALQTFTRAKELGLTTVLDAASVHHSLQDRHHRYVESGRVHRRTVERKTLEIGLADRVLTVSRLARDSYVDAGVDVAKVYSLPMGADLRMFRPPSEVGGDREGRPVRFVFVGHAGPRKGADVLLDAVRRLNERGYGGRFTLTFVGNADRGVSDEARGHGNVAFRGWVSHRRLPEELRTHDVLVLPSRHDSFGMVVVEAMACGLAPLISNQTGAKEVIDPERSGFVVPVDDSVALTEAMIRLIENRDLLREAQRGAAGAVGRYGWRAYRARASSLILSA